MRVRNVWLQVHRYGGLAMAVFLIIVGLTGSIMAFGDEVNHLLSPERYASPRPGVRRADLEALLVHAQASTPPGGTVVSLAVASDHAQALIMPQMDMQATLDRSKRRSSSLSMLFTSDITSLMGEMPFQPFTLYLDPWTGQELARRPLGGGVLTRGVMPFISALHDSLALGLFGRWFLGIIALLWTIDCFVSWYLTLPASTTRFWRRWKPAWQIKRNANTYRLNFDLHRANGLWLWPILFVFAWSSVMFNLKPVYEFVTRSLFDYTTSAEQRGNRAINAKEFKLTPGEVAPSASSALAAARQLAAEEGRRRGVALGEPTSFISAPGTRLVTLGFRSPSRRCEDLAERQCVVSLAIDGKNGRLVEWRDPEAEARDEATGNFVSRWLRQLHYGQTLGLAYRLFVCILGLAVTLLSVTGIYIWWKKRDARAWAEERRARAEVARDVAA